MPISSVTSQSVRRKSRGSRHNMKGTVEIRGDVFDIGNRVKEIDEGYSIRYNLITHNYELYHNRRGEQIQSVLPYKQLDKRTLDYIYETRIERMYPRLLVLEEEERLIEEKRIKTVSDAAAYKCAGLVSYLAKGGRELPSYESL